MPYRMDEFVEGEFYHVYNRGLLKQQIYFGERDYLRFLEKLEKYLQESKFRLHAYCLMPNHFHMLLEQGEGETLTDLMNRLQGSYGRYFNIRYNKKGNVFEGRFKVKHIKTDEYMLQVAKYIHRNPLEAKLVKRLLDYPWSSYRSYLSDVCEPFVTSDFVLSYFSRRRGGQKDFQSFVEEQFDGSEVLQVADELIDIEDD